MKKILGALIAALVIGSAHAATVYNSPTPFIPGPRLIDGSDLNKSFASQNFSTQSGIVAHAGGGATSATLLIATISRVDTVATSGDSVKLPLAVPGLDIFVVNNGAANMNVWPNTTAGMLDTINGGTSYSVAVGATVEFLVAAKNSWYADAGANGNAIIGNGVNQITLNGAPTGSEPTVLAGGPNADTNIGIVLGGNGTGSACLGGGDSTCAASSFEAAQVASAVNHVVATGAATTVVPTLAAGGSGSDTNVGMAIEVKGTGTISVGGTTVASSSLKVTTAASQVDQINIAGSVTGTPGTPTISAVGTDTNINIIVTPKGTGTLVPTGGVSAASQGGVVQTVSPRLIGACGQAGLIGTTATANAASTDVYISEIFVPATVTSTGVAVLNGTTAANSSTIYLADVAGNQVAHTASTAVSGTSAYQLIPWTTSTQINGPGTYYLYFTNNGTTNTWETINNGSCGTALVTGATYGTFKTTTPPTTFTTAQGPSGSLY